MDSGFDCFCCEIGMKIEEIDFDPEYKVFFFFSNIGWRVDANKFDFSGEPEPAYSCISPIRS